jgi:hypothetical protein
MPILTVLLVVCYVITTLAPLGPNTRQGLVIATLVVLVLWALAALGVIPMRAGLA